MPNTTPSPNMNMPVPTVGVDPGPDWANNLNSSLSIVDSHNHSPGQGVQVTPSGLNINADLAINGNNLTTVNAAQFTSLLSAVTSLLRSLQVVGVDLYFVDGNGNSVRITQSGSVTGSAGTITGLPSGTASASYSAGTFTFQGATNTPATMNIGPIITGSATVNSKNVTIQASSSLGANYSLTLPLAQGGANSTISNDGSGNLTFTDLNTLLSGELGYTWVFPPIQGAANTVIANDGSGNLSFQNIKSILTIAGIGANVSSSIGNASVSHTAYTNLLSFTLPAGTWVITAGVQYLGVSSSNGALDSAISTTNASTAGTTLGKDRIIGYVQIPSTGGTYFPGFVVALGTSTTYYLNSKLDVQNDNVNATLTAVRIA